MPAYGKPLAGVCVATLLFTCGASGFPVPPDSVPPSSGSLDLAGTASGTTALAPGSTVTVSGDGFAARANVTVAVYSEPETVSRVTAGSGGHITATFQLPEDLRGVHTITAIGNGRDNSSRALESRINVVAGESALPRTGFNLAALAVGAVGLILAGFALVRTAVFGRRFLPSKP